MPSPSGSGIPEILMEYLLEYYIIGFILQAFHSFILICDLVILCQDNRPYFGYLVS